MANVIGAIDIKSTRVSIVYPFLALAPFAIAQLFLGCDPLILFLCFAAILITFIPLHCNGRDLYSMFAILFGLKYVLAALIAKTFYLQPLQSNLFDPLPVFEMSLLLMIVVTAIAMVARGFDPGKTLFPFPTDAAGLRRLGLITFSIGFVAMVVLGLSGHNDGGGSAGILAIMTVNLGGLCFLGIAAEGSSAIEKSNGKSLFSPLLMAMLTLVLATVIALNLRGYFLTAIICIVVVAFIYRLVKPAYLIVAALIAAFFLTFLSPMTLYLRNQRNMGIAGFVSLAGETAFKMATNPSFYKTVTTYAKSAHLMNVFEEDSFDYFGDRSNVMNRITFIGLLDAVNQNAKTRTPLQFKPLAIAVKANVPTFLGNKKENFGLGDWLNWQMGMETPDYSAFLNFGLPMEGLASWGLLGLMIYPIVFITPVLLLFSRISSFRNPLPVGIYLLADLQISLTEGTSDTLMSDVIRGAPIACGILFAIYWFFFRRAPARRGLRSALLEQRDLQQAS